VLFALSSVPAKAQFGGGAGGSDMMSMIPRLMRIGNFGGGRYGHRRHR
jgi:hypothetical protein